MKKFFLRLALSLIKNRLKSNKFRERVIREINLKVDIPTLPEDQEAALIGAVYDSVMDILK
ncbi:MAG: hypothetical protein GY861_20020 [bacterium]|nr:hypothetical protein [bacterium]